jgi:glycosyltransferase involved in cell wall biosynthesis
MKIGFLRTADGNYGGARYEEMAQNALATVHHVSRIDVTPWLPMACRPQTLLRSAFAGWGADVDLWIRPELGVAGMIHPSPKRKNIAIAHHFDEHVGPSTNWNRVLNKLWLHNSLRCDRIVVVARYWYDYLAKRGLSNLSLIYNAFDMSRFVVTEDQVQAFRAKYGLNGRPIIYLGNSQRRKGAAAAWSMLRSENYHFVTSGLSDTVLPILNLFLSYEEYITLLAASDVVVTMSQLQEGWNRTAHEAMLCKTPVIGSGTGGMRELLEGGGQIICDRLSALPDHIHYALVNREDLSARGYSFASGFTKERFDHAWVSLVRSL